MTEWKAKMNERHDDWPDGHDLEATITVLMAERCVLQTLYRYGHSIDYGLEKEWVDCFTANGVFEVRGQTGDIPNRSYQGREELARFVAHHTRAPDRWHKHLLIEPQITVDGASAKVRSYFTRLDSTDEGKPFVHAFGRYRDELVREADGCWRFTERIAEVEARGPTEQDPG